MRFLIIPCLIALASHIPLSAAYIATVWSGEGCNAKIPTFPSMTIIGSSLNATTTGCIVPSVPLDLGGFSLSGCAIGGQASLFSDFACTKTKLVTAVNNVLCTAVPVNSFSIAGC